MTRRLILLAILLLGLTLLGLCPRPTVTEAAGLQPAIDLLAVGASVSPQYHGLLLLSLRRCASAYASSFVAPVNQSALALLLLESGRAEAACEELIERAPDLPAVQHSLRRGRDLAILQLAAWRREARQRAGLLDNQAPVRDRYGLTA